MKEEFYIVNQKNFKEIRKELNYNGGKVLIYGGRGGWKINNGTEASLDLFFNAQVSLQEELTLKNKLEKNICYELWENQKSNDSSWEAAKGFFDKLKLESYKFEISPNCVVSRGFLDGDGTLFIPKYKPIENAFRFALTESVRIIEKNRKKYNSPPSEINNLIIEEIINYAVSDLKNSHILNHNTQAGLDADAFLGLG